jgi:hypothetical protein
VFKVKDPTVKWEEFKTNEVFLSILDFAFWEYFELELAFSMRIFLSK